MTTQLEAGVRRIVGVLRDLKVDFAVVGGLAVSAQTEPRFTRDADLALSVRSDQEAEKLVVELRGRGYEVDATVEQTAVDRLATVRLLPPDVPDRVPVIDLLFASSGIEPELVAMADSLEVFPKLFLPVARVGHLLALKLLARAEGRPQDEIDLHALLAVASSEDRGLAEEALRMIAERGFQRGKDLAAEWGELIGKIP